MNGRMIWLGVGIFLMLATNACTLSKPFAVLTDWGDSEEAKAVMERNAEVSGKKEKGSPGLEMGAIPMGGGSMFAAGDGRVIQYLPDVSQSFGTESLLAEVSREIAGKVYYELREKGERSLNSRVAVVMAVPVSNLKMETEFGRVMAEYLLTDLADRGLRVTELRLGREIHVLPQSGEFILTRNVGELASHTQELDYVVVCTYSNTRKNLMLQGRLIDFKDGVVHTSWRHNLPLNRELIALFQELETPYKISVRGAR